MSTTLSTLEKLAIYVTGTYKLPKTSMLHVGPPLDWQDAEKLAAHLLGTANAHPQQLPNTTGFSEAQLYDTYAPYVQRHGSKAAQDALAAGEQVIVGLRITTNTRANQGRGVYDDRIAVIWQEFPKAQTPLMTATHGKPVLTPVNFVTPPAPPQPVKRGMDFIANTEPSAQYEDHTETKQIKSKKSGKMITVKVVDKILDSDGKEVKFRKVEGEDVNKDGRKDLSRLVPGTYTFHRSYSKPLHSFVLRGDDAQRVQRDVNHDGEFTAADVWHTDSGDTVIETGNFAILIHPGHATNTDSAGCQTIPLAQFRKFAAALKRTQSQFLYVLVTVK